MPRTPEPKPPQQDVPTVALALMLGAFLTVAFFGLIAVVIPGAAQMGGAIILLVAFFGAQYFVWGRRLYAYLLEKERQKEDAVAQIPVSSKQGKT